MQNLHMTHYVLTGRSERLLQALLYYKKEIHVFVFHLFSISSTAVICPIVLHTSIKVVNCRVPYFNLVNAYVSF